MRRSQIIFIKIKINLSSAYIIMSQHFRYHLNRHSVAQGVCGTCSSELVRIGLYIKLPTESPYKRFNTTGVNVPVRINQFRDQIPLLSLIKFGINDLRPFKEQLSAAGKKSFACICSLRLIVA